MMPAKKLVRMVLANTMRSPRHFILSAFGIVIGIGAFVLFLALTQRAGSVLEKVFPLDEVQVVAPSVALLGKDASTPLDDNTVKKILARPEVKSAVPRLNLAFPAAGRGSFEGANLKFEVGGFADGVDPNFVQDDERIRELFKDWDAVPNDPNTVACIPPPPDPDEDVIQSPGKRPTKKAAPTVDLWGNPIAPPTGSGSDAPTGSGSAAPTGSGSASNGSAAPAAAPPPPAAGSAAPAALPASPAPAPSGSGSAAKPAVAGSGSAAKPAAAGSGSAAKPVAPPAGSAARPVAPPAGSAARPVAPVAAGSAKPPAGARPTIPAVGAAGSGSAGSGSAAGSAVPVKPKKEPYYNPCPEPDRYYCDEAEKKCKHRVPVVLSSTVVELYNNQFAKSHGMPMADRNLVNMLIQQRGLSAMRFSIGLGNTTIAGTSVKTAAKPHRVEAVIVGVSTRAMPVGVTMPIQYIKRWNTEFTGPESASRYSSIIVTLKDRNQLAPFSSWLQAPEQGLRLEDSLGERFATVIFVVRLLFLIISVAILVIAVINIGHNFFIQVSERRREIGIMRAVGATELDVRLLMLGEAAVIGIVGGILGIGLALGIGTAWNAYSAAEIPRFPFKPESWFEWKSWIWGSALFFSTLFCILGGFLPARRAAKMEPAQALAQN